jgi:hypothetical protein
MPSATYFIVALAFACTVDPGLVDGAVNDQCSEAAHSATCDAADKIYDTSTTGDICDAETCMLRAFRPQFELEEANAFHAFAPLAASMRVTNGIPLGCTLASYRYHLKSCP